MHQLRRARSPAIAQRLDPQSEGRSGPTAGGIAEAMAEERRTPIAQDPHDPLCTEMGAPLGFPA
jgi:hypothetical protein